MVRMKRFSGDLIQILNIAADRSTYERHRIQCMKVFRLLPTDKASASGQTAVSPALRGEKQVV